MEKPSQATEVKKSNLATLAPARSAGEVAGSEQEMLMQKPSQGCCFRNQMEVKSQTLRHLHQHAVQVRLQEVNRKYRWKNLRKVIAKKRK